MSSAGARSEPWRASRSSGSNLFICGLVGLVVTGLIVVITEYYTGTGKRPVVSIAQASVTGHGTNVIQGLAVSLESTALPALVIVAGIISTYQLAGLFGTAIAVTTMLGLAGMIVALDAFGPVTDNAGGIAEMAGLAEGSASVDRRARRGRQHHQGGHQGLRDRLGGPGRARAVRGLYQRHRHFTETGAPYFKDVGVGRLRPLESLCRCGADLRRHDPLSVRRHRDDRGRAARPARWCSKCAASSRKCRAS